jgi:uridine phosphorylase
VINEAAMGIQYILIKEAVRDEGTSYHYLPAEEDASINPELLFILKERLFPENSSVREGKSWTTDAPYRETRSAIEKMKQAKVDVVEMEAGALYSFAKSKNKKVVCFAHITNSMAQMEFDFEKGLENGSIASLDLIYQTAIALMKT